MEGETTKQMITISGKCGNSEGRRELMEPEWNPEKIEQELRVLAWAFSLCQDHPDFGFFRDGECKK